jgi:hypothetical protein
MQRSYAGTCNPSLLSGFAFCWHICFKRPPFFISSAWLAHTHPWTNTYTRLTSHLYTLFPLPVFFPLAVHPVNSYVLHGFTHKLCLFWLCTVLWLAYYPTLFLNYLYSDWCVFHVCNWIVCFIHSGIGAWGQRPPSQPLPPLVVCTGLMCCTYWTICSCLTVPVTSWRTMPHVPYSITCIHLHTHTLIQTQHSQLSHANHYKCWSYECVPLRGLKRLRTYYLLPSFVI